MNSQDDDLSDDEIDIVIRPGDQLGRRIVILATLCRRAFLESRSARGDLGDDPQVERFDLRMWLQDHGLDAELTDGEDRLLDADVGSLTSDEASAATWNAEALFALGWSAALVDSLADPGELADPSALLNVIPAPWDDPAAWIAAILPRDDDEIARERERAEVWLWRAEIEEERRKSRGRDRQEIDADIADVVRESQAAGLLSSRGTRDFAVRGTPISDLPLDQIDALASIATVRLHALNWLCGFGDSWESVPLELD